MQKRIISLAIAFVSGWVGWMILFFGHGWIRNYGGDAVVIIFLYATLGGVFPHLHPKKKALSIFLFALAIEIVQSFQLVNRSLVADATIGSTFDPIDIAVYVLATAGCFLLDRKKELK